MRFQAYSLAPWSPWSSGLIEALSITFDMYMLWLEINDIMWISRYFGLWSLTCLGSLAISLMPRNLQTPRQPLGYLIQTSHNFYHRRIRTNPSKQNKPIIFINPGRSPLTTRESGGAPSGRPVQFFYIFSISTNVPRISWGWRPMCYQVLCIVADRVRGTGVKATSRVRLN